MQNKLTKKIKAKWEVRQVRRCRFLDWLLTGSWIESVKASASDLHLHPSPSPSASGCQGFLPLSLLQLPFFPFSCSLTHFTPFCGDQSFFGDQPNLVSMKIVNSVGPYTYFLITENFYWHKNKYQLIYFNINTKLAFIRFFIVLYS